MITNKNYKQKHLELTVALLNAGLHNYEQEAIRQRIHYIECEYEYRPRYKHSDLRPRCSNTRSSHAQRHKHSKHAK